MASSEPAYKVDLYEEDEETKRTKQFLVSDLTIEDEEGFKCRACPFQAPQFGRIRKHIHNIHFSGPLARCKICGFESKNINSMKAHIVEGTMITGRLTIPQSPAPPLI